MNSTLDEALDRLRGASPELPTGEPNHGPMAAEALVTLGCDDLEIQRWTDRYRGRLGPMPEATVPISADSWKEPLGRFERIGDWSVFFRQQLADEAWETVLRKWLGRLLPGIMAAGTHGLIRTAHAVRALDGEATPLRIEELATALGYWAAYYQELPGVPTLHGSLDVEQALHAVPRLDSQYDARRAFPPEFMKLLGTVRGFPAAVASLAAPDSVPAAITALTDAGARFYLANASRYPLVMLHAVTGPAALRLILPHLGAELQQSAFAYVWQSMAAWVAAFSAVPPDGPDEAPDPKELDALERALDTGDEHAIKFVEACIREHRLNPNPAYLAAALDWATRVRDARGWSAEQRIAIGLAIRS